MGRLAQLGKVIAVIFGPIALILATVSVVGEEAGAFVALGFFGVVGLGLAAAGVGRIRAWLRLRGSSSSDPGAVDPGPVEIEGVARPLETTIDPPHADDGVDSLIYERVVKKKRREHDDDGTREYWDTTTNDTETLPFVVAGDSGEVVIDPEGADLLLEDSYSHHGSDYREYVRRLDAGEEVYVAGEAVHATSYSGETDGKQYVVERPSTRVPEALRRLYDRPFLVADSAEETAVMRLFRAGAKVCGLALFYNVIYVPLLLGFVGVL